MNALMKFANPAFYQTAWSNVIKSTTPQVRAGSFMPAINLMMAVGTIGYIQEYVMVGRYHVAHANHTKEAALAEYKEKHGDHGH